jgi:hypothetical protein
MSLGVAAKAAAVNKQARDGCAAYSPLQEHLCQSTACSSRRRVTQQPSFSRGRGVA